MMTLLHFYYEMNDINVMGMSAVSMISFLKQSALALNYKDGGHLDSVTPRERKMAVVEIPSLLTYLSYVLFVGGGMGPFCEFATFDNFIHRRGDYANLKPFETLMPAIIQQVKGYVLVVISLAMPTFVLDINYLKTEEFVNDERGYLFKAGCIVVGTYAVITLYFGAFMWMEA
jgi:hypothetical protein